MNEKNYTSQEFSKKLADAGCIFLYEWKWCIGGNLCEKEWTLIHEDNDAASYTNWYYAYDILNDLCVKYAKEMFGEAYQDRCNSPFTIDFTVCEFIMYFLQQGKKESAEEIVWKHCLFNKLS